MWYLAENIVNINVQMLYNGSNVVDMYGTSPCLMRTRDIHTKYNTSPSHSSKTNLTYL